MNNRMTKIVAGAALIVASVFIPTAAMAQYVPDDLISVSSSVIVPGGVADFGFGAGAFTPGETVSFTLTGENASGATLALVKPAVVNSQTLTKPANSATGAVAVSVTLPKDASGSYTMTATGATSGNVATKSLSVATAGAGTSADNNKGLVDTGAGVALLWMWIAGGALVLVGGGVVVGSAVRRQKVAH